MYIKNTRALLRLDFYLLEHEAKLHKQIVRFVKNHKCYLCSCLASNITGQQCTYTRSELPEYQLGEEREQERKQKTERTTSSSLKAN
jgi:hypothetical protein